MLREHHGFKQVGALFVVAHDDAQEVLHGKQAAEAGPFILHHQVEDAVLFHQPDAFIERCVHRHGDRVARHDLGDLHPGGAFVFRGHLVGHVGLRNHADYAAVRVHHSDGAHLFIPEVQRDIVDRSIVSNGINILAGAEHVTNVHSGASEWSDTKTAMPSRANAFLAQGRQRRKLVPHGRSHISRPANRTTRGLQELAGYARMMSYFSITAATPRRYCTSPGFCSTRTTLPCAWIKTSVPCVISAGRVSMKSRVDPASRCWSIRK